MLIEKMPAQKCARDQTTNRENYCKNVVQCSAHNPRNAERDDDTSQRQSVSKNCGVQQMRGRYCQFNVVARFQVHAGRYVHVDQS